MTVTGSGFDARSLLFLVDLHVDACGVHGRDPALVEVAQLFDELRVASRHSGMIAGRFRLSLQLPPGTLHERRGSVVLFKCDRSHCLVLSEVEHDNPL
jgi:hypothetical protein